MAEMDDVRFRSILQHEIQSAVNYYDSEFSQERADVLSHYLGEPFGNEVENRSQVVATEVSDTIEYMMPSLMKMFTSSPDFARFLPRGPEDVKAAEQATDLVNFAINTDNNGFRVLHDFFKDALLFKVGAIKFHWSETDTTVNETYENLTEDELTLLISDPAIEIISQDVTEMGVVSPDGAELPMERNFSVEVKRTKKSGSVKLDNVPPEELIFSRRATALDDCSFIAHRTQVRAGDLIEQGYDADIVLRYAGYDDLDDEPERQARFEELESGDTFENADPTMREVLVTEAYIKADYDGDNIPELRRVVALGDGVEVLENEPFDHVPFALLSPILMPHRMVGRSVAEMVMDLQLIKSTIMRQMLDNLYLTNNSRVVAVEGQTNLDDLLSSRPGGVVRVRAPGMVQPLAVPQLGQSAFAMLEYVDQVRDQRTGFSKASMGLDPSTLQSTTASAVNATIQGAQLKIEMIARVFAETGCKDLAKGVLHLLQKHQDSERVVRIRGEFVSIDPRAFANGFDLTVEVGLGNGREDEKMAMLAQIAGKQEQIIAQLGPQNPVVKPSQYVNTLKRIAEMAGFKDTEQFFASGDQIDQQIAQGVQQQGQDNSASIEQAKLEAEIALKREKMQAEIALEREKMQADLALRRFELEAELQLRQQKLAAGGNVSVNLPRQ
tara:strand:- start:1312 stop:3315 length:2004 start_codon:yes stop_codon:yes gene_type:complete